MGPKAWRHLIAIPRHCHESPHSESHSPLAGSSVSRLCSLSYQVVVLMGSINVISSTNDLTLISTKRQSQQWEAMMGRMIWFPRGHSNSLHTSMAKAWPDALHLFILQGKVERKTQWALINPSSKFSNFPPLSFNHICCSILSLWVHVFFK